MPLVKRLGLLVAVLAAAAAWSGSALAAAPTVLTPPTIVGSPRQDWRLTVDPGTWTGSPTLTYQWQQWDPTVIPTVWTAIPGATTSLYIPTAGDVGKKFQVVVTATNADGTTTVTLTTSTPIVATFRLFTTEGHFIVHYQSDLAKRDAITETQAGDIGALAERAYAAELADGYPSPLSDGTLGNEPGDSGSRIDIYVDDLGTTGALAFAQPDFWTSPAYGYIVLNGADPTEGLDQHTIAHELFHLIQFAVWLPSQLSDYWLLEGSAEWMGYKIDGFSYGPVDTSYNLGNWDMALDCRDPLGTYKCDLSGDYKNNGYSRWPFFEYVSERYGDDFVKSIFGQGAAGAGSAAAALSNAIAAKGGSLADTFTDWTVANMTGSYSVAALQNLPPPTYGGPIATGTLASLNAKTKKGDPLLTSGTTGPISVPVNHLSARYVALQRGDPTAPDAPCYTATLSISVALPAGIGARPYFWWSVKDKTGKAQAALPLSINGSTASITLPWDTCDWGSTLGYLSLPNPTTMLDAQDFTISGTLTVDPTTQATATPPPDPVKQHGTTVDAPSSGSSSADGVPQIDVFGPEVLRIAADAKTLRLIVSSNGSGKLQATLGSLQLGTKPLRAGGNDLRFTLPKTALRTIRRTSAAANVLTLTPLSSAGAAGTSVTRRVVVQAAAAKVTAGAHR